MGYFEKGRWIDLSEEEIRVAETPTPEYDIVTVPDTKPEQLLTPEVITAYKDGYEYFRRLVYQYREMTFWQRLKFLISPKSIKK